MVTQLKGILSGGALFILQLKDGVVSDEISIQLPKCSIKTYTRKDLEELLEQFKLADKIVKGS